MTDTILTRDLVGELETVLKCDSPHELREANLPLLQICIDYADVEEEPTEKALETVIGSALKRTDSPEREALRQLFLGTARWTPLAQRGVDAAKELGITYDALRRRNKQGNRRLDSLLAILAHSILQSSPLEELLQSGSHPEPPDPGERAFERASVFLSYARADDKHEGGFISALRDSLISEFRFQTGQDLFVFQDTAHIDLGENWRQKIQAGIETTSFLLVILTPSYLRSERCRDELQRFLLREQELRRADLVLPIYYATVPEDRGDGLTTTLLERQYIDWRNLRFQDFDSVPVRMAIAELSASVASAIARTTPVSTKSLTRETPIEELGLLEQLMAMELALPRFVRNMLALAAEQDGVNSEVAQAAEEANRLNRMGRGSTARLLVARRLSSKLEPYAERMEEAAGAIRADLEVIERGIRAIARELPRSSEEGVEETTREMVEGLRSAKTAGVQASETFAAMRESYSDVGKTVSTMRAVLNRMLASATVVTECPARFSIWIDDLEEGLRARS